MTAPTLDLVIQESSPVIRYSPGWTEASSDDLIDTHYNNSFRSTNINGASATFSFHGTGAAIFGANRNNHGTYMVSLDNRPSQIQNGAANPSLFNQTLWSATNLSFAQHTVTITNVVAQGKPATVLDMDYISIERKLGDPGDRLFQVKLDDSSGSDQLQYAGSWITLSSGSASSNTLHSTVTSGSQLIISFQGCCLEVYGQYANTNYSVTLNQQIPVTMTGIDVTLADEEQKPQTLLYLVDGLADNGKQHNVILTKLPGPAARPFFFDYAVVSSRQDILATTVGNENPSGNRNPKNGTAIPFAKTPKGAAIVVGSTIGGFVFLTLLFFGIFMWYRQRKNARARRRTLIEIDPVDLQTSPFMFPFSSQRSPNHVESRNGMRETSDSSVSGRSVAPTLATVGSVRQEENNRSSRNPLRVVRPASLRTQATSMHDTPAAPIEPLPRLNPPSNASPRRSSVSKAPVSFFSRGKQKDKRQSGSSTSELQRRGTMASLPPPYESNWVPQ